MFSKTSATRLMTYRACCALHDILHCDIEFKTGTDKNIFPILTDIMFHGLT